MKRNKSPFKWRHFEPTIILLCVRWYCRYSLSYRDLEEIMRERGLSVDHTTVWGSANLKAVFRTVSNLSDKPLTSDLTKSFSVGFYSVSQH
jgi:transposase-like protein